MMRYSDAELEKFLDDTESDLAERKETWKGDAPEKGRQAVCAFANDLPDHRQPGVLFVGAKDTGAPSGLPITDDLLRTLADIKTDGNTLPPPSITVEKRSLRGSEMAIITVLPADAPPVRYRGRIWIRTGSRRAVATAQDERILNERRRHRDQPYDVHPIYSCPLSELSRTLFEEIYLPGAFAPEIVAANARSYEQRLAACRMVVSADEPTPTLIGLLALARDPRFHLPGAYLQFLRIAGTKFADPIVDEARCEGPLAAMVQRVDDKLDAHNRTAVDITGADREIRRSLYPKFALQQLIRNAVMHRTYESTNAPCRVYWFDDRIEMHSPGGPYGAVTCENFGQPGLNDYRNPNLADAMKVLGLVQRFGVGIQIAQTELAKNGNPPAEFLAEPTRVVVTVRKIPA
ncbi:MAG: putative DNA binding domain-containing protein [Verrucomicrobia bacterium]|nr:putative DNA binding domain-containing protein [Verrucomicrobiota bacterium]